MGVRAGQCQVPGGSAYSRPRETSLPSLVKLGPTHSSGRGAHPLPPRGAGCSPVLLLQEALRPLLEERGVFLQPHPVYKPTPHVQTNPTRSNTSPVTSPWRCPVPCICFSANGDITQPQHSRDPETSKFARRRGRRARRTGLSDGGQMLRNGCWTFFSP